MALVSFLAVYREIFETVLFYQTLLAQAEGGSHTAPFGGIAAAAVALFAVGWAIFKYSQRLPLRLFFFATAVLLAVLAVVFAGQGIAALQEAGHQFIDCDRGDRRSLKELQEDAKRVLGLEIEEPAPGVAARPPRKQVRRR